jgi:hypothetical protein
MVSYHCSERLAPTEDKTDDGKDSIYEELERVIDTFSKYHMRILLRDFNAKVGREDIFKSTIGNESFHEIGIDNGVRLLIFPYLKTSESKVRCCHIATSINILRRLQAGKLTIRLAIFW